MAKPGKKPLPKEVKEFEEAVIEMSRVTRVVKGGRRMRFRATVVIGDKRGKVGYGVGKAAEVQQAVSKAVSKARKRLIRIPLYKGSIPHQTQVKFKSSVIFMKPASEGTGIIAGGAMRQILELAGIKNVLGKSLGSTNRINTAKATYNALVKLRERPNTETDRQKEEAKDGADRSNPDVKHMSRREAKDAVHADKRLNRPAQKKPAPKKAEKPSETK
jgi:small subunit ribosomal protein S5